MTPRRSSRARTTQPPPPPVQTNSSNSLNSSTRAERNTRSNNKPPSPQDRGIQDSQPPDDSEPPDHGDQPLTRRSKRSNTNEKEDTAHRSREAVQDVEADPEEVTRCICGNAEYPGPPPFPRDSGRHQSSKSGVKEDVGQKNPITSDGFLDDTGNFFIQCDSCQVWQHGGCVGLLDESMSPDDYFCEECKPDFHKLRRNSDGSQCSRYLPVLEASSPEASSSSSRDKSRRRDGKSRHSVSSLSTKRRATMNSRDAAYDEDEMLRRAIEESRETGTLGKRTRDESEQINPTLKRRRTSSDSLSQSKATPSPSQAISEDESLKPNANGNNGSKKVRGAAARNNREKEHRDRQKELAAHRVEAANKRNARSERRRGDDSPPPTPTLSPNKIAGQVSNPPTKSNVPETPSSHRANQPNNHRKMGRPPARRGRLGRNQYTRDQHLNGGGAETPLRDISRDPNRRSSPTNASNGMLNSIAGESGRSSRPKYHHPNRTSMNEMKRRVAAILEFVNKMHGDKSSRNNSHGSSSDPSGSRTPSGVGQSNGSGSNGNIQPAALIKGVEAGLSAAQVGGERAEREFRDMASGEMLHILTRELVGWQSLYGRYGEK